MPTGTQRNKGTEILVSNDMCKQQTVDGDQNDNTNIGLLNVSSESFGQSVNTEMVVELIGLTVLLLLALRWVKKCFNKRKLKQRRALQTLLHGGQVVGPAQPAQHAQPPVIAPAPAQLMVPMGARAMPALEYKCAEPREVWTQA